MNCIDVFIPHRAPFLFSCAHGRVQDDVMAPSLLLLLTIWAVVLDGAVAQTECNPLFYPEGCGGDRLVLERHSFVDNLRKEVSCYVRGHSSESIIVHVLLVFGDPVLHFHNALLINPASLEKYQKILRESEFPFNNELRVVTKGQDTVVQYDVAQEAWQLHYFDGASLPEVPAYDALLSLDYYASLWSEYNSLTLERSRLTLRMLEPPFDEDRAADNADYDGFYKLWCNYSISVKRCHVLLPFAAGAMPINGAVYNVTGLVIDPSRGDSLLPYDLYVRWRYHDERNLRIADLLHLNHQFEYDINRESGDIVLGLDFLLLFQKAEYCMEAGYYKVWYYNHLYSCHERHLVHVTLICLFVTTLLTVFFYWVTSTNYDVLQQVLAGARRMPFPFLIILCELLTYAIGVAVVIMALVFVDNVTLHALLVDATGHKRRLVLFTTVLACHLLVGLVYVAWFRRTLTRKAARYYLYRGWNAAHRGLQHADLRVTYSLTATPAGEAKLRDVIVRNTTLNTVLAMSLLLIFNYLGEDWPLFLAVNVVVSAVASYYWLKMLLVSLFYLVASHQAAPTQTIWRYERRFLALTLLSFGLFLAYVALAFPLVYVECFREFNSMYSDIFLWIFAAHLHCIVGIFAAGIVFIIVVRHHVQARAPPPDDDDDNEKKKKKTD
jgi:hypothetical protein